MGEEMLTQEMLLKMGADENCPAFGRFCRRYGQSTTLRKHILFLRLKPQQQWSVGEDEYVAFTRKMALNWLRNRDPRVAIIEAELDAAAAPPPAPAAVFEPEQLQVGDVLITEARRSMSMESGHISTGRDVSHFHVKAIVPPYVLTYVAPLRSSKFGVHNNAQCFQMDDLRSHITSVTRSGKLIWPVPQQQPVERIVEILREWLYSKKSARAAAETFCAEFDVRRRGTP